MRTRCILLLRACSLRTLCGRKAVSALLHTSTVAHKDHKIFYNKYIEQIRRKKRVYTGYAEDILKEQRERTASQYEDYQEELVVEGRKRQSAYIHSKRMREVHKGAGPRLLTLQQMDQVRFLQQTDPTEWDIQSLAHSFQVPELVIRKVLRNRIIPKKAIWEKLDNKARANHRLRHASSNTTNQAETALTVNDKNQQLSKKEQWGLPEWKNLGWFAGYERVGNNEKEQCRESSESQVQWLDDDECEFYEDLYQCMEEKDYEDDSDNDMEEQDLKVNTDDGKTFYSADGELIYKI